MKTKLDRNVDRVFRVVMAIVVLVVTLAVAGWLLEYMRGVI